MPLRTHSKTCLFSAEVLDILLQCLPLTRRRLLAKRFDQRCSRKFVILREAYGPGTDACAIAFEESLLGDEICNICGEDQRMEWWNKDGSIDHSMVPGSYVTGFTMLDFEFFPFPGLEKLQMDKFSLEEKVRNMESKEREQTRELEKLQLSTKAQKNDTIEIDRLKRETRILFGSQSRAFSKNLKACLKNA